MLMTSCEQVTSSFHRKLGSLGRHLRDGGWAMSPQRYRPGFCKLSCGGLVGDVPGAGVVADKIPAAPSPKHEKSGLHWENPRGATTPGRDLGRTAGPGVDLAGFRVPAHSEVSAPVTWKRVLWPRLKPWCQHKLQI